MKEAEFVAFVDSRWCVLDVELFVDMSEVVVDGGVLDVEPIGDFLFHESFSEQFQYFDFALGKRTGFLSIRQADLERFKNEVGTVLGCMAANKPNIIVFLIDDQDKESTGRPYGELVLGGNAVPAGQVDEQLERVRTFKIKGKDVIIP